MAESTQDRRLAEEPGIDFFISYQDNETDRAFAERLVEALESRGVTTFFAPRDVQPGRPWAPQLDEALERAAKVAVVVSRHALESQWVTVERSRTNVIPLLRDLGPKELPPTLQAFPALDFRNESDFEASVDRLAGAAGSLSDAGPPEPGPTYWRTWLFVAAAVFLALVAFVVVRPDLIPWLLGHPDRFGWWEVEAVVEGENFAPGQPLRLRVRADHDGFLWIFSPVNGDPNRVFPCAASAEGCTELIGNGPHSVSAGKWRPVPEVGRDRYGVIAGSEAGSEDLIVLVTLDNDPEGALAHLASMRPDLSIRAGAASAGGWGATVLGIEVRP
jgi:hypothetical protein